jgi:ADP-heptose:LPS heptosyltransferase
MGIVTYEQIHNMVVLADYSSPSAVKALVKQVQEAFPDKREIEFLFYVDEKSLPEMLPVFKGINYSCKGDFNWLGVIQSDKLLRFIRHHEFDVLIYCCDKNDKNVQKITKILKYKFSIGFERENFLNFDLAFITDSPSNEQLLSLATTYLKQL